MIPDDKTRVYVDVKICAELEINGLPKKHSIYIKHINRIQSIPITAIYSLLHVLSGLAHNNFNNRDNHHSVISFIVSLPHLICTACWWTSEYVDGLIAVMYKAQEGRNSIHQVLNEATMAYLPDVHSFRRLNRDQGSILDKPVLHRLL